MAKKVRLTNFARFFIFLVIVIPAAYGAASYINGEDPVQNIKELLKLEEPTEKLIANPTKGVAEDLDLKNTSQNNNSKAVTDNKTASDLQEELKYYRNKVKRLEQRVEELEKENFKLKQN